MNWDAADRFCRALGDGARLPTREEYEALGRAMGRPNNYRSDMIADMRQNWFWSSSVNPRIGIRTQVKLSLSLSPGLNRDPR